MARAWDLTVPREGFGHECPVIELTQVGDLAAFKQADRFVLTTYSASEIALKVIGEVDRLRATSQGTGEFAKAFPSPPGVGRLLDLVEALVRRDRSAGCAL